MTEAIYRNDSTNDDDGSDQTVFDQLTLLERLEERLMYGALFYAGLGMPVFPVKFVENEKGKKIKKPCIKDWPNEATTDPEQIVYWWTHEFAGAMIGVVTGKRSGWCVLDVDCKNGSRGFESLTTLADELIPVKPSTQIAFGELLPEERLKPAGLARTQSGGLHLWYRLDERHRETRGKNVIRGLPGLELKATGTYVVAAPSDGYEWVRQLPVREKGDLTVEERLAGATTIPEELLYRLLDGSADGSGSGGDGGGGTLTDADGQELKLVSRGGGRDRMSSLTQTLMTTPEGQGNNTVFRQCCDVYPYVVLRELGHAEVDRAVMAGVARWGADEDAIKATMRSAWKKTQERRCRFLDEVMPDLSGDDSVVKDGTGHARSSVDDGSTSTDVDDDIDVNVDTDDVDDPDIEDPLDHDVWGIIPDEIRAKPEKVKAIFERLDAREIDYYARQLFDRVISGSNGWEEASLGDEDLDPVPNVLTMDNGRSLIYSSEFNLVWGKRSAGKSWLTALATLQQVQAGRHVVILDYENGRPRIRNRLRQIGLTSEEIKKYVHVFIAQIGGVPTGGLGFDLGSVGLVVIDSMTGALRAMDLDSLRGDEVETFRQRLVVPFQEAGAAVLALDHVAHNGESHDRPINSVHKLNMAQGSGYLMENVKPFAPGQPGWSWIRLWKDNGGGTDQLVGDNVGRLVVDGSHENVKAWVSTDTSSLSVMKDIAVDKVDQAMVRLDELDVPVETTVKRAAELLRAGGFSVAQNVVSEAQKRRRKIADSDLEDSA